METGGSIGFAHRKRRESGLRSRLPPSSRRRPARSRPWFWLSSPSLPSPSSSTSTAQPPAPDGCKYQSTLLSASRFRIYIPTPTPACLASSGPSIAKIPPSPPPDLTHRAGTVTCRCRSEGARWRTPGRPGCWTSRPLPSLSATRPAPPPPPRRTAVATRRPPRPPTPPHLPSRPCRGSSTPAGRSSPTPTRASSRRRTPSRASRASSVRILYCCTSRPAFALPSLSFVTDSKAAVFVRAVRFDVLFFFYIYRTIVRFDVDCLEHPYLPASSPAPTYARPPVQQHVARA